jgi:hypothetical protein
LQIIRTPKKQIKSQCVIYFHFLLSYSATTYDSEQGNSETNTRPRVLLTPSVGSHLLTYKGKWLWVSRNRFMNALDFASGNFLETINISTFGRDRKVIHGFISECMDAAFLKEEGRTVIWSGSGGSWR